MNNKVVDIDGLGHATAYVYDPLGRNTFIIDANNGVRKKHDALYLREVIDPVGNKTSYVNDEAGRVIRETDAFGKTTIYQHDLAGRLTQVTDRLGRQRVIGYDLGDRKTAELWKDSEGNTVSTLSWTYNAKNQPLTATQDGAGYVFAYDALARPISQTDPHGLVITTEYWPLSDRVKKVSDNRGGNREYFYYNDSNANVSFNNVKYVTFSGTGLPNVRWDFGYDKRDVITQLDRYSDLTATNLVLRTIYQPEPNGLVKIIDHLDGSSNFLDYFHYEHDNANRVSQEESRVNGMSSVKFFTYDITNQVVNDGSSTYTFDKNGNRTLAGYVTGFGNRLATDGTWNYSYDDEGYVIQKMAVTGMEAWVFGYNHRNQMTLAQEWDLTGTPVVSWQAHYEYDALGNRQAQIIDADGAQSGPAVTTKFASDANGNAWADLDVAGNVITRRLYLDAVDAVFAKMTPNGSGWDVDHYLTDRLGSVRDIYSSTGILRVQRDYDSFGNMTNEQIHSSNPGYKDRYAFTGREPEPGSGLQYNRGRWYAADIGRWTGEDPLKFGAGDFNLYRYVHNSPTNATDPSGLIDIWQGIADFIGIDNVSSWDNVLGHHVTGGFAQFSHFSAGIGDTVSFGMTRRIRSGLGYDNVVDYSSGAYAAGTYAGQVLNIGLMVANPYGAASWAQSALRGINTMSMVSGAIGAGEAALNGDFGAAAMMLGGAALHGLRGAGSFCGRAGQFGLRTMSAFGTATAVAGGIGRIQDGDWLGGSLDLLAAGIGAYRTFAPCFTGDMLLDAEDGKKRADAIQVGDRLWSRSEFDPNGPIELKEVEEVFVRASPIINLHVGGQIIRTTAEHPFWVEGEGWLAAAMIEIGDLLTTRDGRHLSVPTRDRNVRCLMSLFGRPGILMLRMALSSLSS